MAIKQDQTKIFIPHLNTKTAVFTIKGTTPLIYHKWAEKAIEMMLNKQLKKELKGREERKPVEEYEDSFYFNGEKEIAFPANSLKQAIVDSARNLEGVTMSLLRGALFVVGDTDGMIQVLVDGKPAKLSETIEEPVAESVVGHDSKNAKVQMRRDMVRVGMGSADIRFRGQVKDWSMVISIKYNADLLSLEQIASLIQYAGFACGIGEWRAQKNGDYGSFELATE